MSVVLQAAGFAPSELSSLVHRRVVDEHAGEAGFLWSQRQRAVSAPHFRLEHLRMLDARVQAHLAALRTAGEEGWHAALRGADPDDTGALFTLSRCGFDSGQPERMRHALAVALAAPDGPAAVAAALAWGVPARMQAIARRLLQSPVAAHRAIGSEGLRGLALHDASTLEHAATDADAGVRAGGLRAIGESGHTRLLPVARRALDDPDPACAFSAAWSLALRGDPEAARRAFAFAHAPDSAHAREAVTVAMRRADAGWARDAVRTLASNVATRRLAIVAAGAFGDPVVLPWLIDQCEDEALAAVAGEAISTITGADLRYLDLDLDRDRADPDAPLPPEDESLPCPDPAKLRHWWQAERERFVAGQRHLAGQPLSAVTAAAVLCSGFQRQRAAAAIELAGFSPQAPLFLVERRADRQWRELAT